MSDSIASVFVDVILDTKSISTQLLTDPRLQNLKIAVDSSELHDLNKLYDVKKKHHGELATYVKNNPIKPAVNLDELHNLNKAFDIAQKPKNANVEVKAKGINTTLTEIDKVTERIGNIQKTTTTTIKAGVQFDKNQVAKEFENVTVKSELLIKDDRKPAKKQNSVFTGFQEEIGRKAMGVAAQGLKEVFGLDSKKEAEKLFKKITVPVKAYFDENTDLKASLERTGKLVEERLRRSGYALGAAIVEGLKREELGIKERVKITTDAIKPQITPAFQQVVKDVKTIGKDTFKSATSIGDLNPITDLLDRGIRNYKEGAIRDLLIPMAIKRAAEIEVSGKKVNSANQVNEDTEQLFIATGGYAGAKGLSGKRIASSLKESIPENSKAIWIRNSDSDVSRDKDGEWKPNTQFVSMTKQTLRGFSLDSVEMLAQSLVGLQKNPQLKIELIGESGGSDIANETAQALGMMGFGNVNFLGVGAPEAIGTHVRAKGKKILSRDEVLGQQIEQIFRPLSLVRKQSESDDILGLEGHPFEYYQKAETAELMNFVKGRPNKHTPSQIQHNKEVARQLAEPPNEDSWSEGLSSRVRAEQAAKGMEMVRRELIAYPENGNEELKELYTSLKSTYLEHAQMPPALQKAKQEIREAASYLKAIENEIGLGIANNVASINSYLKEMQLSLKSDFSGSVGTEKLQLNNIEEELSNAIEKADPLKHVIPQQARTGFTREDIAIKSSEKLKAEYAESYFAWEGAEDPLQTQALKSIATRNTVGYEAWDGNLPDPTLQVSEISENKVSDSPGLDVSASKLSAAADRLIEAADRLSATPNFDDSIPPLSKVELIPDPRQSAIQVSPAKDYAVQTVNLVANGIVNLGGKAIAAAYGAEQAIFGKTGTNVINTIAAATVATHVPGGQQLIGAAAEGVGAIANMPLSALAGQGSAAIAGVIDAAIGNAPILKALAPQITAAITEAIAGGAAGISTTIGTLLTPLLAGAGILKGAEVGAKMLPGFDPAGNGATTIDIQNAVVNLMRGTANLVGQGKQLGEGIRKALPEGVIEGEIVSNYNPQLPPPRANLAFPSAQRVITQDYGPKQLPAAQIELSPTQGLSGNINKLDPIDNGAIVSEVERIHARIKSEKAAILKLLKSGNPEEIEAGLVRAGSLGLGFVHLKSDLRAIAAAKTIERDRLVDENPQYAKKQNIPGYAEIENARKKAAGIAQDKGATTRPIYEQIEKIEKDKNLVGRINPNLIKQTAIGTGVFGTVLAALTTGAQAATVGGGAAAGGGLLAALTPLLPILAPALGIGAVGALGYGAYKVNQSGQSPIGAIGNAFSAAREKVTNVVGAIGNRFNGGNTTPPPIAPDPTPDPANGIAGALSNAREKLRGAAGLIGTGIVALIGFQFIPMVMGFITQNIGAAITKAIASENIALTLKATSTSNAAIAQSTKEAKSLANQLGVSELETRGNLARFQSSIVDTPLEGQAGKIVSGVSKYGKSRGATSEEIGRGTLAFSQIAGKGQLYAEEVFGQLGESLPGSPLALAAASGLTVKQLRTLMKAGGVDGSSTISRFSDRANAEGDINLKEYTNSPQAKIGKLQNSVEVLQTNLGAGALAPLGAGADAASKAIDLLTKNIGLLAQLGGIAILKFGVDVVGVIPIMKMLGASIASINMQSFASGIGMVGNSLKALAVLAAPLLEFAIIAVALTAVFDGLRKIHEESTGGDTPGKAIEADMEKAYLAIKKVRDELAGISGPTNTRKLQEDAFDKSKTFTDHMLTFVDGINSNFENKEAKAILAKEAAAEAKKLGRLPDRLRTNDDIFYDEQVKYDLKRIDNAQLLGKQTIDLTSGFEIKPETRQKLDKLNLQAQLLNLEEATDRGLDPDKTKKITKKQIDLFAERSKIEQPIQQTLAALDVAIKASKSIVDNPLYQQDERYKSRYDEEIKTLAALEAQQKRVNKELSVETIQRAQTAYAIEDMTTKLSASRLEIDRFATSASRDLSIKYTGSLAVGSRTREQSELDIATIGKRIEALTIAISQNRAILERPEVSASIKQLQSAGRLPEDLSQTNDEQLKYLKSDPSASKTISKNDLAAIENMRAYTDERLKASAEEAGLTEKRKSAIAAELKASNEYYVNSIFQIKQTELASAEASREIKSKSYSSQLKGALEGVNSATAGYMNSLIDQYTKMGELTKIEADREKANADLRKQEWDAKVNRGNRQDSNTIDGTVPSQGSGEAVVSPLTGATIDQLIDYQPARIQRFTAFRRRKGRGKVTGYPQGANVHGAIDYDDRIAGGVGASVQAPISGVISVAPAGPGYGQMAHIKGKDRDGIPTTVGLTHIVVNNNIVNGAIVKAGTPIGKVIKLGKEAQGAKDHLDFTVAQNGDKIDPNPWWRRQKAAGYGSTQPASIPNSLQKGNNLAGEIQQSTPKIDPNFFSRRGYQSALLQDLSTGKAVAEYNSNAQSASSASTMKLLIARMVQGKVAAGTMDLRSKILIDPSIIGSGGDAMKGKQFTLAQLLKMSLVDDDPSNTSANGLIKALGGVDTVNAGFKTLGFKSSRLGNMFSIPGAKGFQNKTTAKDLNQALIDIEASSDSSSQIIQSAIRSPKNKLGYKNEIGTKPGYNSKVLGSVGVVEIGGVKYALTQFYDVGDSKTARSKLVQNTDELETALIGKSSKTTSIKTKTAEKTKTLQPRLESSKSKTTPDRQLITTSTFNPGDGATGGAELDASGKRMTGSDYAAAIPGIKKFPNSIPVGSKLRVTLNGKSVIVEVRDAGPYIPGRKLDLTTAAAKRIGLTGVEQTKVELIELPKGADPDKTYTFGEATYKPKLTRFANTKADSIEIYKAVRSVQPSGSIRLSGSKESASIPSQIPLPASKGTPGLDNESIYKEQIDSFENQRKRNDENAATLKNDAIIRRGRDELVAQRALRKGQRDKELAQLEAERKLARDADASQYLSPKDEQRIKLRDKDWARRDAQSKATFDRIEIKNEIADLQSQEIYLKSKGSTQAYNENPQEFEARRKAIQFLPEALRDAEARLKFIDNYIVESNKVADASEKFLRDDFAEKERLAEMGRSIEERNRVIGELQTQITKIETYQKTNPLDITLGDPLLLKAEADRLAAANAATQETIDLDTKAQTLDRKDPRVARFIKNGKDYIQNKYQNTLKNIADGLEVALTEAALARDQRTFMIDSFNTDSRLSFRTATSQFYQAEGRTAAAKKIEYDDGFTRREQEKNGELLKIKEQIARDPSRAADFAQAKRDIEAKYELSQISAATQFQRERELRVAGNSESIEQARIGTISERSGALKTESDLRSEIAQSQRAREQRTSEREREVRDINRDISAKEKRKGWTQAARDTAEYNDKIEATKEKRAIEDDDERFNRRAKMKDYDVVQLDKQIAYSNQALAVSKQLREFDIQLKAEIPGSEEAKQVEKLRAEFEKLSQIKLNGMKEQFSQFNGIIAETSVTLSSIFDKWINGKGVDLLDIPRTLLKGIMEPIEAYSKSVTDKFIGGITKNVLGGTVKELDGLLGQVGTAEEGAKRLGGNFALSTTQAATNLSMPPTPEYKISPVLPEDPRIVSPSDKIERIGGGQSIGESLGYNRSTPPSPVEIATNQQPLPVQIIKQPQDAPPVVLRTGAIDIPPPPDFSEATRWKSALSDLPVPVQIIDRPSAPLNESVPMRPAIELEPSPRFEQGDRATELSPRFEQGDRATELSPLPVKIIGYTKEDAAIRREYTGLGTAKLPDFQASGSLFESFDVSSEAVNGDFDGSKLLGAAVEAGNELELSASEAGKVLSAGGSTAGGFLFEASKFAADALTKGNSSGGSSNNGGGGGGWIGAALNLGRAIFKFEEGGTVDSNGVLNSHLPPSPIDNRFIKMANGGVAMLRDGESILTPETTKGLGGGMAVKALNAQFKFADGGTVGSLGGATLPPPPKNFNPSMPQGSRAPLKIEYTKIGDRDYVDRQYLEEVLQEQNKQNERALTEYDRKQQDMMQHSVAYRSSRR